MKRLMSIFLCLVLAFSESSVGFAVNNDIVSVMETSGSSYLQDAKSEGAVEVSETKDSENYDENVDFSSTTIDETILDSSVDNELNDLNVVTLELEDELSSVSEIESDSIIIDDEESDILDILNEDVNVADTDEIKLKSDITESGSDIDSEIISSFSEAELNNLDSDVKIGISSEDEAIISTDSYIVDVDDDVATFSELIDEKTDISTHSEIFLSEVATASELRSLLNQLNKEKEGIANYSDGVVVLNDDLKLKKDLYIEEEVILDLGGHTIFGAGNDNAAINIVNSNVTIKNGSILGSNALKEVSSDDADRYKNIVELQKSGKTYEEYGFTREIKNYITFESDGRAGLYVKDSNILLSDLVIKAGDGADSKKYSGGEGGEGVSFL